MSKPKSAIKIRKRWKINPKTKVQDSAKRYSRSRAKKELRNDVKKAA